MNIQRMLAWVLIAATSMARLDAATVVLSLYPNQTATGAHATGQFRITAKVLGNDSAGLSGYGGDLTGNILDMDHRSPRDPSLQYNGKEGPAGFTLGRSADNLKYILATQDIGNSDTIPIYGFGQVAGAFPCFGICFPDDNSRWDAELLIATGQFTGTIGWNQNGPNRGANVFNSNTGLTVRLPDQLLLVVVPEPAMPFSAAAIVIGVLGVQRLSVARHRPTFA